MVNISYIIDLKAKQFYFFEEGHYKEAQEKQVEIIGNYNEDQWHSINIQHKRLKKYYGTVWLARKFTESGACHYYIEGSWKLVKGFKDKGYIIKKFVLTPYEEYNKRFEEPKEVDTDIQDLREMID